MYLNVPMLIYKQVFRFQVSVDEVQGVKVLKGEYYLSCIKSCMVFTARGEADGQTGRLMEPLIKTSTVRALYLNLPIRLRCENISPPGTYSITM